MPENIKKSLLVIFKIILSATLCFVILLKIDIGKAWNAIQNVNPMLLTIVFGCMIFCVTISTYKWQRILAIHGNKFSFRELHRFYFMSLFFNNFLPTSIGGDAYRIFRTMNDSNSKSSAFIAVFTERLTGFWALLLFGFAAALSIRFYHSSSFPQMDTIIVFFIFGILFPVIISVIPGTLGHFLSHKFVPDKIRTIFLYAGAYYRHGRSTALIILVSFFFHLFTFFWMCLLLSAIEAQCPFFNLVFAMAISNVVALLPISINGIGLTDGSFIYIMGLFGTPTEISLVFMLIVRFLTMLISLFGAVIYMTEKKSGEAR